jgi:ribosomal protein S27AE
MAENTADSTYVRILDPQLEAASHVSTVLSGLFHAPGQQLPLFPENDDWATRNHAEPSVPPVVAHIEAHNGHLARDADREEKRAYHRAYYRAHAGHLREYYRQKNARYRAENPAMLMRQRAYNVEYDARRRNSPKQQCREKTKQAIRKGLIVKPDTCSRCGASGTIHAHHPDYAQPFLLEWLCRPCHDVEHRQIK